MTSADGRRQDRPAQATPAPGAPASPTATRETAPEGLDRAERGIGRRDPLEARGLVRLLVKPAAFLGANWAALLGVLTVVGIVPALAGATRVTSDLEQYEDSAFTTTLRHARRTLVRDAPASLLLLLVAGGIAGNALVLPRLDASLRVFAVGVLLPLLWALIAMLSAYVVAASRDEHGERAAILLEALRLVRARPVAALAAPPLIALLSPLWLLAPLTIAIGLSVPPWVVGRLWSSAPHIGAYRARSTE
ncbi:hypothetical protein [Brachybacterium saurashtrense]|uniref:DUF624 domain-containing protein n=1 Tax=Brachybacterium saurashtrense TaxID=556288 RepID=A0A345YQY0_9MICO|nr:hypothetical protein [Brachybacterium saurashtrense]AXK46332.1 hypothetical protein DWV08_12400 [Brachybacterium saurashtrense]RRR24072.1 hypothetical protein DXU92_04150 [Brachybacterium saurashtrense]